MSKDVPIPLLKLAGLEAFNLESYIRFVNIGERTNVTGSKAFARLILNNLFDEALSCCSIALKINPDFEDIFLSYLFFITKVCNWDDFSNCIGKLELDIISKKHVTPFRVLGLLDKPELHFFLAKTYCETEFPRNLINLIAKI